MKLIINFSLKEQLFYSNYPSFFHSIFSEIILKESGLNEDKKFLKKDYSFSVPKFKMFIPQKIYKLEFVTNDNDILNSVKNNFQKNPKIKESFIQEVSNNYIESKTLLLESVNFKLSENICKNWDINNIFNGSLKILNYSSKYGTELLKELIEYQVAILYERMELKPALDFNSVTKNNKQILSFIEEIIIDKDYFKVIKNHSISCVDIKIKFKNNLNKRIITNIANLMLNTGIGGKNSYGFGFVRVI